MLEFNKDIFSEHEEARHVKIERVVYSDTTNEGIAPAVDMLKLYRYVCTYMYITP
jgi:hypothetical protein